jgi:spermidine synthase
MSLLESLSAKDAARTAAPARLTPLFFALTIFVSAFMLFAVQPMFTKMVLPTLGGSPAVWSVAMAFFQALLLLGYLYAHCSARWLGGAQALAVHCLLLAGAFLLLPLSVTGVLGAAPETGQGLWLVGVFGVSVGLPFFVLAATAPLLQSWFARSGHPEAANPYKLYVASNLGSFCALIAYPLAVEPMLALQAQTHGWMALFAILAGGLAACGLMTIRGARVGSPAPSGVVSARADGDAISWGRKAVWTGLAAVPSGLLVAVTAHLSTDVASAPLLWVVPLAIFLLTFILAFRDREVIGGMVMGRWLALATPLVVVSMIGYILPLSIQLLIHLGFLFLAAMICHRTLYLKRPGPSQLTEFYLWMSFGGMLGGLFAGLAAPLLFNTIMEYRLLIIAALLCAPAVASAPDLRQQAIFAALGLAVAVAFNLAAPVLLANERGLHVALTLCLGLGFLAIILLNRFGPVASAGAAAAAFLAMSSIGGAKPDAVVRSFFGVNYVKTSPDGDLRLLMHGSTIHGAHRLRDLDGKPMTGRPQATTYYHDDGGINLALAAARAKAGGRLGAVAMIGLGAGAMACQSAPGETWVFFEIDREVVNLARRPDLFPFVSSCTPNSRIVVGDGRLTLQKEAGKFDVILLDAFSSDAVPAHLLTREAFSAYAAQLNPGGVIIAHVSNRYMDLRRVAEAAGLGQGMATASAYITVDQSAPHRKLQLAMPTTVVAMSKDSAYIDGLLRDQRWRRADDGDAQLQWTDDYANITGAMVRHFRQKLGWAP